MIVAISRAKRFSPNSEDKDARILRSLCRLLENSGLCISIVDEDGFRLQGDADAYISMARSEAALRELSKAGDTPVFNSPGAVMRCQDRRKLLETVCGNGGPAVPPPAGGSGFWVKKNLGYTGREDDVVYAADCAQRDAAVAAMRARGIDDVYVGAHIEGDLVKFYGVAGTPFFRYYYPDDDGDMKFSNKGLNGTPRHYAFDKKRLMREADTAAYRLGLDFYGGDCIVRSDGSLVFIDFNDWPSYSRCCDEAAEYMAVTVIKALVNKGKKPAARRLADKEFEGIIFDYGGTLDSGGMHWGKRIWHAYQQTGVPVDEPLFRDAYVHAERTLAKTPIIKPGFNFTDTLRAKLEIELDYIRQHTGGFKPEEWLDGILSLLVEITEYETAKSRLVLETLSRQYGGKMVLVSNFYGNVNAVLDQFCLKDFFSDVIESAVVGVRKPDPEIYRMGIRALGVNDPSRVLVVGDSYDKDILPARSTGCHTIWFMGEGWTPQIPDGKAAGWAISRIEELLMTDD